MPPLDINVFAQTNFRNERRAFGIKTDDRRRHMYLIGKTGMGKSTTLENMILSDIRAGYGLAVVDPHGDLVEKIIDFIPSNRVNDVIYFNPSDSEFPIAFNIIEVVDEGHKHLIASGLVGVFKKIYAESWGPRLEYVLRNAILALLDYPGSTLLGIMRILVDTAYRKKVVAKITDPVVRSFWVDEYAKYPDKFATEAIAPIQNKVGQFLSNSLIRNIVGQVKSAIDMRAIMDDQKILLVNLAKGRIGEDTAALLGAMMITKLQLAAMERIDMPEKDRKDFYLYVDEFQNFATDSFANILSEARKYRLNLIIAHQYIEQLNEVVRPAVFGNVGTIVLFRVGAKDAEELESEFSPRFTVEDLVNLKKFDIYLKLMIDGVSSDPFSATILPPLQEREKTGNREKIVRVSRERYAKPRAVIEEKIARWTGMLEGQEGQGEGDEEVREEGDGRPSRPRQERRRRDDRRERPSPSSRDVHTLTPSTAPPKTTETPSHERTKNARKEFPITCALCKKQSTVSFNPDPRKPVYCKECLKKVKSERQRPTAPSPQPSRATTLPPTLPSSIVSIPPTKLPTEKKNVPTIILPAQETASSTTHHPARHEKNRTLNDEKPKSTQRSGRGLQPGQKIQFD